MHNLPHVDMANQRATGERCSLVLLLPLLLVLVLPSSVSPAFNYTKCPAPWELQSDTVKQNFSLKKFEGIYHELAFHDYTQSVCPSPKCIQSNKIIDYKQNQINDTFNLVCEGINITFNFRFALTNITGFFLGKVVQFPYVTFPDTVVDVHEGPDGAGYEWVIEFQCLEKFNHVTFTGINFYSKLNNVSEAYVDTMLNTARKRGLGVYMDAGFKVYRVDQNCTQTNTASEYFNIGKYYNFTA